MSRGLGELQRKTYQTLNASSGREMPMQDLRREVGVKDRSNFRRCIAGLERRGLVSTWLKTGEDGVERRIVRDTRWDRIRRIVVELEEEKDEPILWWPERSYLEEEDDGEAPLDPEEFIAQAKKELAKSAREPASEPYDYDAFVASLDLDKLRGIFAPRDELEKGHPMERGEHPMGRNSVGATPICGLNRDLLIFSLTRLLALVDPQRSARLPIELPRNRTFTPTPFSSLR